ncbi:MAG: histidine kinase [Rhodothermales bacterium]|nr:histidine kinase [Rhodothermales bacterium]
MGSAPEKTKRRARANRIALKVAAPAALLSAVGVALSGLLFGTPFLQMMWVTALLVFVGTYAVSVGILARRLALGRTLLHQIRHSRFENLKEAKLARGDELNDLVRQVYRTGQVLQREMAELRRMEDYRRDFIGNVSHELKTPIFAIRGFAETLDGGALENAKVNRKFVQKILRNADRLDHLARDLGEIARIEQGELIMSPEPFSMRLLAHEIVESLEPIATKQSVRLDWQVPADLPDVMGDREHIRQVVVNLMENAIKYNNKQGFVRLVARVVPTGEASISVIDNGLGIPAEVIHRITERFFRVDKSRSRAQGGTGLGLAIVKHILAAHDRSLIVESREGVGSTFGFTLPLAEISIQKPEDEPALASA